MSRPDPGTYIIYNRVLTPAGERLAITFNGNNNPVTVTALSLSTPQRWVLENYDANTQHIKPQDNQSLECCFGSSSISILPRGNYVWNITRDDNGYIIKDGGKTIAWGLNKATGSAQVIYAADSAGEKQRWIFQKADVAPPP